MRISALGGITILLTVTQSASAPPKSQIDVLDYMFDVTLPQASDTVSIWGQVSFRRDPGAPDTLSLDLVGMTVDAVSRLAADSADSSCADSVSASVGMCVGMVTPFTYDRRFLRIPLGKLSGTRGQDESVSNR